MKHPALWLALACALGACHTAPRPPQATPAPVDRELVRTLAVTATGQAPAPTELDATVHRIAAGTLTLGGYIEELVTSEAFARDVAPLLLVRHFLNQETMGAPEFQTLSVTKDPTPIYYLDEPCKLAESVEVHPWWELIEGRDTTIRVCPAAVRVQRWVADLPPTEAEVACNSVYGNQEPGEKCGCGPNLLRCFPSGPLRSQVRESMRAEVRRTVAHEVAANRPLEEVFTANESVRDRLAEYLSRMYAAESAHRPIDERDLRALAAWPADGQWAPRPELAPGQHAGIITTPQIIHYTLDRRQRMTAIDDVVWCIDPDSVGASPETLLSIVGADLQIKSEGWKDLAARPICTNCHARLDYGFQFFWGYPNDNLQAFFIPSIQKSGRGPVYVRDITDSRGDAELTPQGFAQLATKQPEFRRCMARDFAEYVLGNRVRGEQVATVEAAIRPGHTTARDLMRVALGLLVEQWPTATAGAAEVGHGPTTATPAPSASRAPVPVSPELHAALDKHCLDCHDHEPGRPDLSGAALDRKTVVAMLESVASGRMPKGGALAEPARAQFLASWITPTWSGADAEAARAYYVDRFRSLPAFRPEVAFALIHHIAKSPAKASFRMMENAVHSNEMQLTPGFIGVTGLEAIDACAAQPTRADRDRCIADAMKLDTLTGAPASERRP